MHKEYDKIGHNYSNLAKSQILFYKHEQHIIPDNCIQYEQNRHILLWDITTNTQNLQKIAIISHIWNRAKFYFKSISSDHGAQYEGNPSSNHGGLMDGQTDPFLIFPNSA